MKIVFNGVIKDIDPYFAMDLLNRGIAQKVEETNTEEEKQRKPRKQKSDQQ